MARLFSPFRRCVGRNGSIRVNRLQGAEEEGVRSQHCANSRVSTFIHAADSHREAGRTRRGEMGERGCWVTRRVGFRWGSLVGPPANVNLGGQQWGLYPMLSSERLVSAAQLLVAYLTALGSDSSPVGRL